MIDVVRSSYGYMDEYILSKRFVWLTSSVELIIRRMYNERSSLANMIAIHVGNLFTSKDKRVEIPTYDELAEKQRKQYGNHDEEFMDDSLTSFGI